MTKPLQVAHRGGAGLWPENTMAAFERAIDAGADGIELDVHLTRDGKLVVHHDESLKPAIARGPGGDWVARPTPLLKDLTAAELAAYDVGRLKPGAGYSARYPEQMPVDGARVPLLAEVYELVKARAEPGFRLYVELKTALLDLSQSADPVELADAAVALTREHELDETITFVSFDWRALARAKEVAPGILNAFTTLPFFHLDPEDPSAVRDKPGSEDEAYRRASASGAPWVAGFDWRAQKGASFAERMLRAIAAAPADGWFAWHGDATADTAALAHELGLAVSCWTVDEEAEMERLAALGVEAILTDRPDRLSRLFAK
ncbi:glycerophosphoryl diester phosphodiesterase [Parvibaculum lavamentivorans DS-1]|uniref:Glycerophosphoryl diester phosphodiesterase n=1 Tax=Parvibaculum lavamentivorans (strain DS-1 / DSM 13023 / NCIMB 13966) TaxID=402881 RepID=A7HPJ8_PARL1|nr:glycerophosphodiester phosphodiesterase family protein [Parvibaculum lavamentivorans]ABS61831.1 glycerophosphoryl diester phosphodiesterase [Parvibaculum lavamentivorans DS-1]